MPTHHRNDFRYVDRGGRTHEVLAVQDRDGAVYVVDVGPHGAAVVEPPLRDIDFGDDPHCVEYPDADPAGGERKPKACTALSSAKAIARDFADQAARHAQGLRDDKPLPDPLAGRHRHINPDAAKTPKALRKLIGELCDAHRPAEANAREAIAA